MITFALSYDEENYAQAVALYTRIVFHRAVVPNADPDLPGAVEETATILFDVYKAAGRARKKRGYLLSREYAVPSDKFAQFFGRAPLRAVGSGLSPIEWQCERFAIETLDVVQPDGSARSFFHGGIQS